MSQTGYIDTGTQQLHYQIYGHGGRLLLAFHGYGNNATLFEGLGRRIAHEYTTLSIDLPHHGKSLWKGGDLPWKKEELLSTVTALMKRYGASRVSLAGFSMGGRVCLNIMEQMPRIVDMALLLASDGLVPNTLYWFVTKQPLGKRLFHSLLQHPERYIRFADWLQGRRLIPASRHRFLLQYVSSPVARSFLEKVWPGMRLLVPDQRKVRANIQRFHIRVHIFMGRYDRIIPLRQASSFAKGLPEIKVHILEKGHRIMDAETLTQIAACLITPEC